MPFINADNLAAELGIGAYEAAEVAEELRRDLVQRRKSFSFETVLSDPVGAKVAFLLETRRSGYRVLVHYSRLGLGGKARVRGGNVCPKVGTMFLMRKLRDDTREFWKTFDDCWVPSMNSSSMTILRPKRPIGRSLDLPSRVDGRTGSLP